MRHKYKIGDRIEFTASYDTKCSRRFSYPEGVLKNLTYKTGMGYVTGTRTVIMSEFKYISGYCGEPDESVGKVTGKREQVLLVTHAMHTKPVLVRFQDIISSELKV